MAPINAKKVLPIGVDLGNAAARLVQLRPGQQGWELAAFGVIDIPPHLQDSQVQRLDFLSNQIPRLLKSGNFRGRKCVLALPAAGSFVRHVCIPRGDAKATESAIHRAVQSELPYPLSEAVLRHVIAGEVYHNGEPKQEVIVVAMPLTTLDAYLNMTRRAGMEVVGVNVEPLALLECIATLLGMDEESAEGLLILDIGTERTQAVICRGRHMIFARMLRNGANRIDELIARSRNLTYPQAQEVRKQAREQLTDEFGDLSSCVEPWLEDMRSDILQCLRYYQYIFRMPPVGRIIFTGDCASDQWLCRRLAERVNLPGMLGDPLRGIGVEDLDTSRVDTPQPALAVGTGLCLSGLEK
jgi:type IV pilus assembly protein PilM